MDDAMSGQPKDERTPDENAVKEEYAETAGFAGEAATSGAQGEAQADEHEVLLRLMKENAELKDARLRVAAEMENLRRALEAIPQEARDAGDAGFKALIEGVEMTERAMLASLEKHGVKKVEPEGERFDPNFHQAMFEVPREDVPSNTVVQVVQTGYVIGDRVLRPAMVGVSRGGPKPTAAETPAPEPGPPGPEAEKDA
jgi:molecular chaperone GrpE